MNSFQRGFSKFAKKRAGAVVPLVAVMLLVLLVVGGVAVDYARLRLVRLELQAAADNVARSVSNELLRTDSRSLARSKGMQVAAKYKVGNGAFSINSSDIEFGRFDNGAFQLSNQSNNSVANAIRVHSGRSNGSAAGPINMIFGSLFGVNYANLDRSAVASFRMVDICFVLDRSSSMKLAADSDATSLSLSDPRAAAPPYSDSRWRALDNAFDLFIDELGKNDAEEFVGIVSFASDFTAFGITTPAARTDLPLTPNLSLARTQMNSMSNTLWNGNTFIEAGMQEGISTLRSSSTARANAEKIMIVLTDGYQNEGDARIAATAAASNRITVHTITFGDYADRALMGDIATTGGGRYAHADDAATLQQILLDLAVTLTTLVQ
jgi:Ca-activated chloride channel homolog